MMPLINVARKSGLEAKKIRDEFADYFSTTDYHGKINIGNYIFKI